MLVQDIEEAYSDKREEVPIIDDLDEESPCVSFASKTNCLYPSLS